MQTTPFPQRLLHLSALAAFACIPLWLRLSTTPLGFNEALYVSRFVLLLPMLLTVGLWLLAGLPGFAALRRGDGIGGVARRTWALALLSLALWAFLSNVWAFQRVPHPEVGLNAALQFGVAVLFAVAVACAGPSPRAVAAAIAISAIGNALIGILQSLNQGSIGVRPLGEYRFSIRDPRGFSVIRAGEWIYIRPFGLMPHPNGLAGSLVVGTLALGAWLFAAERGLRILGILTFCLGLWALLLTFSRAAWGGVAVGALLVIPLLWPSLRQRWRTVAAALIVSLVVVGAFIAAYRPLLAARAGEGQESIELRSIADRIVFTEFAVRAIREHPLLGVGAGNFPWQASYYLLETFYDLRGDNVHNIYLSTWAELGTIGLLLQLTALVSGIYAAFRRVWLPPKARIAGTNTIAPDRERVPRIALLAVALALCAIGLLDHYPYTFLQFQLALWGCLGIAAQLPRNTLSTTLTEPSVVEAQTV